VRALRAALIGVAALFAWSCGSSSAPSPTPNLSGIWSGMLGEPRSGSALRLTWVVSQTGTGVTGPATIVKPSANVPATGTMSGTIAGSQLTLAYSVPAGGVPVFLSCTISGNGTATVSDQVISGNLQITVMSCLGSGLEAPDSSQFSLTRQ
jgi:hypothetical protein